MRICLFNGFLRRVSRTDPICEEKHFSIFGAILYFSFQKGSVLIWVRILCENICPFCFQFLHVTPGITLLGLSQIRSVVTPCGWCFEKGLRWEFLLASCYLNLWCWVVLNLSFQIFWILNFCLVVCYDSSSVYPFQKNLLEEKCFKFVVMHGFKTFQYYNLLVYVDIVTPGHFKVDRNFNFSTPYSLKRLKG